MKYNFFAAEFRENAGENDVGGGGGVVTRRQVKQVITLQRAMIKKGRWEKQGDTVSCRPGDTTLVTPLVKGKYGNGIRVTGMGVAVYLRWKSYDES